VKKSARARGLVVFLLVATGASLSVLGCGSDRFSPTGSSLPIDVNQDSLHTELDPPLPSVVDTTVTPDLSQPFEEREILYLGNRPAGAWRGTFLLRFDFSQVPDTVDVTPETLVSAKLELEMLAKDAEKAIQRTLRLHELTDTLTASMADDELSSILGDVIEDGIEDDGDSNFAIDLPDSVVLDWIAAAGHKGIAVYDLTADIDTLDSNFIGVAAKEFTRFGSMLDPNRQGETAIPEIVIEVTVTGGSEFVAFPVIIDLTHFERADLGDRLEVGAHLASRSWLTFEVLTAGVPSNATINQALLRLFIDEEYTLGALFVDVIGYRTSLDNATVDNRNGLEVILNGVTGFNTRDETELAIDVTELVQRAVNGVLEEGDGVLLAQREELLELNVLTFHPSTAAVDSLRPRVDVIYTPPADFVE
jgi:hypothetical protein